MAAKSSKYLQIVAYVMITAIFVFVMGIARNCSHLKSAPREGFSGGDTLDIALLYAPGSFYTYGDTLDGINLAVAKEFEKETDTPVKIWPVNDPADGLAKLQNGAFDILASLPLDNNLKKQFPVSESIFLDRFVLVQEIDSMGNVTKVESSLDLNGKKVYVAPGSSAKNRLSNLSSEIGGKIEIEEAPDMSDELLALSVASGAIPLAVVNERIARDVMKDNPQLHYVNSVSFTQFQVWVFNPADSLEASKFNSWFSNFSSTPRYQQILSTY